MCSSDLEAEGWELVAWVPAGSREAVLSGLVELGLELGVRVEDGPSREVIARRCLTALASAQESNRLIVFDDVENPDDLKSLIEMAFKIAASMGFKEAMKKAAPVLMEPIMSVEVVTPEDYVGDVIGDLSSRRGRIEGMDMRANARIIRAYVPLVGMFGYATDLRSKISGRANYTMQFDHYEPTPADVAKKVLRGKAE